MAERRSWSSRAGFFNVWCLVNIKIAFSLNILCYATLPEKGPSGGRSTGVTLSPCSSVQNCGTRKTSAGHERNKSRIKVEPTAFQLCCVRGFQGTREALCRCYPCSLAADSGTCRAEHHPKANANWKTGLSVLLLDMKGKVQGLLDMKGKVFSAFNFGSLFLLISVPYFCVWALAI